MVGPDECIYGIPSTGRRVAKFNTIDSSFVEIGPDLGPFGWWCGVLAKNNCIYCAPNILGRILKIDTVKGTVTVINAELSENGYSMWSSGALGLDGCIYFMPCNARRILKLDPKDDSVSSVGDDLGGDKEKFTGTLLHNDGNIVGIPRRSKCIARFHPKTGNTSFVGGKSDIYFYCSDGVLGRDGKIYSADDFGNALMIDVTKNVWSFLRGPKDAHYGGRGWRAGILGNDGSIYWPPCDAKDVLKLNTDTEKLSLLECYGIGEHGANKWHGGGAVASDGAIYCFPYDATQILKIDPFNEFAMDLKNKIERSPETLCSIFSSRKSAEDTFYERSVRKFGKERILQAIQNVIKNSFVHDELCEAHNAYPFMIAASFENCPLSVILYLVQKEPSLLLSYNKDVFPLIHESRPCE